MEDSGIEPLISACKADVFPLALIPHCCIRIGNPLAVNNDDGILWKDHRVTFTLLRDLLYRHGSTDDFLGMALAAVIETASLVLETKVLPLYETSIK